MKMIFIIFIFVININCTGHTLERYIWGVWNDGDESGADLEAVLSIGKFWSTMTALRIDPDSYGKAEIGYQGGYYILKDVIYHDANTVYLIVEDPSMTYDKNLKPIGKNLPGKVIMHFIDNDHVWFELDYSDQKYPTHPSFTRADFRGRGYVFWRARSVN